MTLMPGDGDDSLWGRTLSKDEIKALPRLMREPVEDQEASARCDGTGGALRKSDARGESSSRGV
eukprot:4196890-Prymnesium_polylepis.1